jgi:phosphoglycolate phosphatase-like HAD superfamily hydrolase
MASAIKAVCFDFNGVICHHESKEFLTGIERLLLELHAKALYLGIASRIPVDMVAEKLDHLRPLFESHIYSGGGKGKLACIENLAQDTDIQHLSQIAFVDDKPDNLLPVANNSNARVIGFRGSGKYPHALNVCRDHGLQYANDVNELKKLLIELCQA